MIFLEFYFHIIKDNCEYVGCGPYPVNENEHFFNHYNETKKSDIHCLFINVNSYKIICIDCNQEIYDLETFFNKILVLKLNEHNFNLVIQKMSINIF